MGWPDHSVCGGKCSSSNSAQNPVQAGRDGAWAIAASLSRTQCGGMPAQAVLAARVLGTCQETQDNEQTPNECRDACTLGAAGACSGNSREGPCSRSLPRHVAGGSGTAPSPSSAAGPGQPPGTAGCAGYARGHDSRNKRIWSCLTAATRCLRREAQFPAPRCPRSPTSGCTARSILRLLSTTAIPTADTLALHPAVPQLAKLPGARHDGLHAGCSPRSGSQASSTIAPLAPPGPAARTGVDSPAQPTPAPRADRAVPVDGTETRVCYREAVLPLAGTHRDFAGARRGPAHSHWALCPRAAARRREGGRGVPARVEEAELGSLSA